MNQQAHLSPRLCRGAFLAVAAMLLFTLLGCVPTQIKQAAPVLSVDEASYAGQWFYWGPTWHRLYSILPGDKAANCGNASVHRISFPARQLTIRNCSSSSTAQTYHLGQQLELAFQYIENRFAKKVHVSRSSIVLIAPKQRYLYRQSQLLHSDRLRFGIAVRFDPSTSLGAEIEAVRVTAHELYHMAHRALRYPDAVDNGLTEESRAAIFESCVEKDVFGSVRPEAFTIHLQSDPEVAHAQPDLYASMAGNFRSTQILASLAGEDLALSSFAEIEQFDHLCKNLIHQ